MTISAERGEASVEGWAWAQRTISIAAVATANALTMIDMGSPVTRNRASGSVDGDDLGAGRFESRAQHVVASLEHPPLKRPQHVMMRVRRERQNLRFASRGAIQLHVRAADVAQRRALEFDRHERLDRLRAGV